MSSSSRAPALALDTSFRILPSSEPRNITVRSLPGPAETSTAIWVSLDLPEPHSRVRGGPGRSWEVLGGRAPAGGPGEDGSVVDGGDGLVHQRVGLDEGQRLVRELDRGREVGGGSVPGARSGSGEQRKPDQNPPADRKQPGTQPHPPRAWNLLIRYRRPGQVAAALLLEPPGEDLLHLLHVEGAHGRPGNAGKQKQLQPSGASTHGLEASWRLAGS